MRGKRLRRRRCASVFCVGRLQACAEQSRSIAASQGKTDPSLSLKPGTASVETSQRRRTLRLCSGNASPYVGAVSNRRTASATQNLDARPAARDVPARHLQCHRRTGASFICHPAEGRLRRSLNAANNGRERPTTDRRENLPRNRTTPALGTLFANTRECDKIKARGNNPRSNENAGERRTSLGTCPRFSRRRKWLNWTGT